LNLFRNPEAKISRINGTNPQKPFFPLSHYQLFLCNCLSLLKSFSNDYQNLLFLTLSPNLSPNQKSPLKTMNIYLSNPKDPSILLSIKPYQHFRSNPIKIISFLLIPIDPLFSIFSTKIQLTYLPFYLPIILHPTFMKKKYLKIKLIFLELKNLKYFL
jgi:hypothetical protein